MKKFKFLFALIISLGLISCDNSEKPAAPAKESGKIEFFGNTQGTTFTVICNDPIQLTREEIVSELAAFDDALSGYIPNSIVSLLNTAGKGIYNYTDRRGFFDTCYNLSQKVYAITDGAFDPTVYPLVDGWGFLRDNHNVPDSAVVDELIKLLGFTDGKHFKKMESTADSMGVKTNHILKLTDKAKLDFNAIAQGYSVDVIADFLEDKGAQNYFVEIGGEIRVKGVNADSVLWRIGIDKPVEHSTSDNRSIQDIIQLENRSIATSGSYRKFYEKDGVKYSHTLDPKTGYPVQHNLLSATVVTETCAMADALATAFMVMGTEKAIEFIRIHPELNIEAYFIYVNNKGRNEVYYTKNFRDKVIS
ncbi:FAD:protein FMN transferase [Crocinitomix catalasitica]|uniref:FAD:protein FMN transferase n=1 Tax=Crocinitomix catalasitica TaxID=184607 RepID=UPI0004846038|nr:FAD:protein FMN transferase [Crocinitomix catalasitica]